MLIKKSILFVLLMFFSLLAFKQNSEAQQIRCPGGKDYKCSTTTTDDFTHVVYKGKGATITTLPME